MLFYDLNDQICIKISDNKYKVLYDRDIFKVDEKYYMYSYHIGIFYAVSEWDGDMEVDYDTQIHPRKMNIKEMAELFDLDLL